MPHYRTLFDCTENRDCGKTIASRGQARRGLLRSISGETRWCEYCDGSGGGKDGDGDAPGGGGGGGGGGGLLFYLLPLQIASLTPK